MNKISFLTPYLFLFLLILVFKSSQAQFSCKVKGIVKTNGRPLIGATVNLSTDTETLEELQTNSRGSFSFSLKPNEEYYIAISKPDYADCNLVISTIGISKEDAKSFDGVTTPLIEMIKLPEDQVAAEKIIDILSYPMYSYYYNEAENKISLDQLIEEESNTAYSEIKNIVDEYENKENPAALVDLKYKKEIADGDAFFVSTDYEQAKISFSNALTIKPNSSYPRDKIIIIDKILLDKSEKERIAKENALATAAEKERIAKEKEAAEAAEKERLAKEKELADLAESERQKKEKAEMEALEKERIAKEAAAAALSAEQARIAKEKELAEAQRIAKEKELAALAENERLKKEKEEKDALEKERIAREKEATALAAEKARIAKEKELAEAAEKERIAMEKAKADAIEAARIAKEKALADAAEKERLAKEEEIRILNDKYASIIYSADSAYLAKSYAAARLAFNEALTLKPSESYPKQQLEKIEADILKFGEFENELAKKYPQGITEENEKEGNTFVTRRILVQGNKGFLYVKKRTSFGTVYYFKDGVAITENEYIKNTEIK